MNLHSKGRSALSWMLPILAAALLLAACGGLGGTPSPSPTSPSDIPSEAATATPEAANPTAPVTLSLWLPTQFDPNGGQLAATLLQDRLDQFGEQHPSVRVDVRLKAASGEGGMLESLLAAQGAAPLALPDLVLLHSDLLPAAAEAELLHPAESLSGDDWYSFARQMATWGDQTYAWPFAADALVTVYRPTAIDVPPASWDESLDLRASLAFAAADPAALFTTSQLIALGADPAAVSEADLTELYTYYAQAQAFSIFPFWLAQFENPDQSWQAFTEGRAPMVAAWSSQVLVSNPSGYQGAPLLTAQGEAHTLVQGWSWASTTPLNDRAEIVAELAAFLSDAEFMSQWSAAAGYLPTRASALAAWAPDERQMLADQLVGNASVAPSPYVYPLLGPALREAVVALVKQEITPEEAVTQTLEQLSAP